MLSPRYDTPPPARRSASRAPQSPGKRHAPQREPIGLLEDTLRRTPGHLAAVAQAIDADPSAISLPASGTIPILSVAMSLRCPPSCLRLLIAHGAQMQQLSGKGLTPLASLLASTATTPAVRALQVRYAIVLLGNGAVAPEVMAVGEGNEPCARCVLGYSDALAADTVRRWKANPHACRVFSSVGHLLADFVYQSQVIG